jgi:hypothetical protein
MTNNKSKRKTASTKSLTQSRKQSATKSGARSQALTPASGTSRATSRASSQPSRRATVEESDDEDEVNHIGGTLDTDDDRIMEPADQSDSESEDDDSKLSKTKPVFILVSRNTYIWQIDLRRNGQPPSMPSSGRFLLLSMLKAVVATLFSAPPRAANRGGLDDTWIKVTQIRPVICANMRRDVGAPT